MNMEFVVPDTEKTFGRLSFSGAGKAEKEFGSSKITTRSYALFSSVQRADDVVVILPGSAGEKHFDYDEEIVLKNPKIGTSGRNIDGQGFTDYLLYADDITVKTPEK